MNEHFFLNFHMARSHIKMQRSGIESVILRAADMPQAVEMARAAAQPGDIVSLSPACASFDSYPNFEARGRHYKELVNAL